MDFRILGPLEVWSGDRRLAVRGGAQRALLAALLLHANEPVSVDRLIDALWGQAAGAGAVKRLQVGVSRLRRVLRADAANGTGDPIVTTDAGRYLLQVEPEHLDAARFERLAGEGRAALDAGDHRRALATLDAALALWRGRALADVEHEAFAQAEIARLEELRLAAIEDRVQASLALGRQEELVGELRALVAEHPGRERLRRHLMLALYRAGRQVDALDAYRQGREWMREELGLEPGPDLRRLQQAILRHDAELELPHQATEAPPFRTGPAPDAVRAPDARLIGREDELAELTSLLRAPATRLVTLLGPGGVGKTRLAAELAWTLRNAFADGVRFVGLAGVGEASHLASSIAQALDVPALGEGDERAALLRFIGTRELLIVLDNFEHLSAASPLVGDLLAWCPRVTVLATSREPLRLSAERVFRVAPLALPGDANELAVADLERFGATAMFVERARARDRTFSVAPEEVHDVLAICRRLDGLPLALELATARLGVLSVGELAARLSRSLGALGTGVRDAPERHSTLRSTIDWSVELLGDAEREAFVRFAVFAGGATVEAAEAVLGAPLDVLDSLVAKQLIVRARDRLTLLETTREYAAERLEADPAAGEVRDRHLRWCLGLAEEHAPELVTRRRGAALALLNGNIDNLRAALAWSIAAGRGTPAVALAGALGPYWWRANHDDEGRHWLDEALRIGPEAPPAVRARALVFRARVSRRLHEPEEARDLCDAAELFAAAQDRAGVARCLAFLGVAERSHGQYDRADAHIDEAVRTAREAGDPDALATALTAAAMRAPGFASGSSLAAEAIAALQAVGNVVDVCSVCSETGYLAIRDGRYADALPWLEQALIAAREAGDPLGLHLVHGNQALALLFCGEHREATELFARSLELCRDFGFHDFADESLFGLAAIAVEEDRLERAARLAGAARAHGGGPNTLDEDVVFQRLHEQYLVRGRSRFGEPRWDRAMLAGGALSFDDAVDLALERPA